MKKNYIQNFLMYKEPYSCKNLIMQKFDHGKETLIYLNYL